MSADEPVARRFDKTSTVRAAGRIGVDEESVMSILDRPALHDAQPATPPLTPTTIEATEATTSLSVSPLTRDFLAWVASTSRSYADAMEAWRTSCPRFTIWEDAIGDGLVSVESQAGMTLNETGVVLTPRGRAILDGA